MLDNDSAQSLDLFDINALIASVHGSFRSPFRERITRDLVEEVIRRVDFSEGKTSSYSAKLHVQRLKFTGEKRLQDGTVSPINYDQPFKPGVNIIFIPDNGVGKSSILKTVKFALTGDNSDYDNDVRKWITSVWLVFALDQRVYTILLTTLGGVLEAALVPGEELRPLVEVIDKVSFTFHVRGAEDVKMELQNFFFRNFGFTSLSWNQQEAGSGLAERSTTWLTYFQGLMIPDGGDKYLICDPQHAIGNQDGLIVSTFLGLNLAEPLNRLGTEISRAKRTAQQEQKLSEDEQKAANAQLDQLEASIQAARQRISAIEQAQKTRRAALSDSEPTQRLSELAGLLLEKDTERKRLEQEREGMTGQIKQARSAVRRYREQAALQLHFTGLTVSLCPNCDASVSDEAISREQATHECRLCGTTATAAGLDEIAVLEAEAERAEQQVQYLERGRAAITERLAVLREEIGQLNIQLPVLKEAVAKGVERAFPTAEEQDERDRLLVEVGRSEGEKAAIRARLSVRQPDIEEMELRSRILEKVRTIVQEEAQRRNAVRLEKLGVLTQEFARQIGTDSISDLTCTSLGRVQMRKHGEQVPFSGIHNEGDRLRVKLTFFIAMMRLGREESLGRHPGFLLVDQPGSGEMVDEDLDALAAIFKQIDDQLAYDLQIICCTARPAFAAATAQTKIYGAQASPYAF
jgi:hypothetical protein